MKTLNEYIDELMELQDNGYGKCVMIFATDDEGNSYHAVHNSPSLAIAEDLNEYYIELMSDRKNKKYNAIIVN